jgi:hypothetical protein
VSVDVFAEAATRSAPQAGARRRFPVTPNLKLYVLAASLVEQTTGNALCTVPASEPGGRGAIPAGSTGGELTVDRQSPGPEGG